MTRPEHLKTRPLSSLTYGSTEIRRVIRDRIEMFSLRDVLLAAGYTHTKNHSLYFKRAAQALRYRLRHGSTYPAMVFATKAGTIEMLSRLGKPEAARFLHWFTGRPATSIKQPSLPAVTNRADHWATLAALKADIQAKEQALHTLRVQAATLEALATIKTA